MKRIILLDLNYTLAVTARDVTLPPLRIRLETETYRQWLVDLLRPERVLLITARPARWADATLRRIQAETGWLPEAAFFNEHGSRPHVWKGWVVKNRIFPACGSDPARYYGIESNPQTRAVYAGLGISSTPIPEEGEWQTLP